MRPDDRVRLQHIVDALRAAIEFTQGHTRKNLDQDQMLVFALVHAIQIVGEAASKVSEETRALLTGIPWPAIVGMRHRLVHAYFDVDLDILWATAVEAAPTLLAQIETVLVED